MEAELEAPASESDPLVAGKAQTIDEILKNTEWYSPFHRKVIAFMGFVKFVNAMQILSMVYITPLLPWTDSPILLKFAKTIFFAGWFFGAWVGGEVSGAVGRRKAILLCMAVNTGGGLLVGFADSAIVFCTLRFFVGFGIGGAGILSFVYCCECFPNKLVNVAGNILMAFFTFGFMLVPIVCYLIGDDWRMIALAVSLPTLAFYPVWQWWMLESPRWLLVQGKKEACKDVLVQICRDNGTNWNGTVQSADAPKQSLTFYSMLTTGGTWFVLSRQLVLWFSYAFTYYGLSLSSVDLPGSKYLNVFLSATFELPAVPIGTFSADVIGRRWTVVASLGLATACCFIVGCVQEGGLDTVVVTFAMIGKLSSTVAFNIGYIHTGELFPTEVRSQGVGMCSQFARVGAASAPLVTLLKDVDVSMPYLVFGMVSLIAGSVGTMVPETKGNPTLETMADLDDTIERYHQSQQYHRKAAKKT